MSQVSTQINSLQSVEHEETQSAYQSTDLKNSMEEITKNPSKMGETGGYLHIELDLLQEELSCMQVQEPAKEEEERRKRAITTRQAKGQVDIKSPLLL